MDSNVKCTNDSEVGKEMDIGFDLELLPSDPFQQLDVARKITSIALSTRVSTLESKSPPPRCSPFHRNPPPMLLPRSDGYAAMVTTTTMLTSPSECHMIKDMYPHVSDRSGQKAPLIADDVYEIIMKLDSEIIYDRDFDYDYFGFKTLERSYLLKIEGNVVERPQHMLMRVAVGIHKDDIDSVIKTYHLIFTKEEQRARDLFYALWVPDLFMERVQSNGTWSLFCPNEAPGLADCWGKEFENLYTQYEKQDSCNRKSNQQNLGTIKSSNMCTEIIEYTSPTETAVCNLASIALPIYVREKGVPAESQPSKLVGSRANDGTHVGEPGSGVLAQAIEATHGDPCAAFI
ncbi:hypothetical protein L2E82_31088 [Cichorium intybus]|uniref:Uncharacterized protein n=1 Tax=Cichorium intybus TaxID=13427 RepID=A0ACB9D1Z8_CICIN|nr:hypothetical protein L2E82_31088 [Cichorium intybus]